MLFRSKLQDGMSFSDSRLFIGSKSFSLILKYARHLNFRNVVTERKRISHGLEVAKLEIVKKNFCRNVASQVSMADDHIYI